MLKIKLFAGLDHLAVGDVEILVEFHAPVPTGKGFAPFHVYGGSCRLGKLGEGFGGL